LDTMDIRAISGSRAAVSYARLQREELSISYNSRSGVEETLNPVRLVYVFARDSVHCPVIDYNVSLSVALTVVIWYRSKKEYIQR
jgi:hypothetical protein